MEAAEDWRMCMRAKIRASLSACVRACVRVYVRACVRTCVCAKMRACVRAKTSKNMHTCVRTCVCVLSCVSACMLRAVLRTCDRACCRACVRACCRACMRECVLSCCRERASVRACVHAVVLSCVPSRCRAVVRVCGRASGRAHLLQKLERRGVIHGRPAPPNHTGRLFAPAPANLLPRCLGVGLGRSVGHNIGGQLSVWWAQSTRAFRCGLAQYFAQVSVFVTALAASRNVCLNKVANSGWDTYVGETGRQGRGRGVTRGANVASRAPPAPRPSPWPAVDRPARTDRSLRRPARARTRHKTTNMFKRHGRLQGRAAGGSGPEDGHALGTHACFCSACRLRSTGPGCCCRRRRWCWSLDAHDAS